MNLRERTRRLALLLGVAGFVAGGFGSYIELLNVLSEREYHRKFEQLANSDVVQQERKNCLSDNPPQGYAKLGSQLQANSAGIKAINWTEDCRVLNLETDVGEWLYPEMAAKVWQYLLIALLPILGYFIPWGAVRAIGWVGAGFVERPK